MLTDIHVCRRLQVRLSRIESYENSLMFQCLITFETSFIISVYCRDAVSETSLHFLAKMKIMVVKDVEREDIEFYSRILGCRPVASIDHFVPEALGSADLVEEISTGGDGKIIQVRSSHEIRK